MFHLPTGIQLFWQRLPSIQKRSLVLVIILLIALPAGIYLTDKTQIFNPRASQTQQTYQPSFPTDVKVLVLKYFPVDSTGNRLDIGVTGQLQNSSLDIVRNRVNTITNQGIDNLTEGSRYHGYKNQSAPAYLNYSVFETKEFLKTIPKHPDYNKPDYMKILTEDVNICDYVDNKSVRQVWMWGYHHGNIAPDESNMSMGRNSQVFWNEMSYGDISNSDQINDMPTCQNTYTLYNYNFERGLGELLEDHGHQIGELFGYIDNDMYENRFVRPFGQTPPTVNNCGWTHSPPNTTKEYDWNNTTDVVSDCEDWKPDGSGETKTVNCHTWQGERCLSDNGVSFKVWWMQNIPGFNNGLTFQGRNVKNWWEFYGDLDTALAKGYMLTTSLPGDWQYLSLLPAPVYKNVAVTSKGYLFSIGGFQTGDNIGTTAAIYSAKLNSDGTLGDWLATTSLPEKAFRHTGATYGDYLYVLGGFKGTSLPTNVYSTKVNSDGTLGSWVGLTSMPLVATTAAAYNGRLYITGGQTTSVYAAEINNDGTIGQWSSLESLPQSLDEHTIVISNGYIFVLGGRGGTDGYQSQSIVYSAKINNDGTLGSWNSVSSLPKPLAGHSAVVYQDYIYVIGGDSSIDGYQSAVYVAKINSDGTLGSWVNSTPLPSPLYGQTSVETGGYFYTLGGMTNNSYSSVVFSSVARLPGASNATPTPISWPTPSPLPSPSPSPAPSPSSTPVYQQTLQLLSGWNLVGLTVDKGAEYKASNFAQELNGSLGTDDVTHIVSWKGGRYVVYVVSLDVNDFPIISGEGYWVRNGSTSPRIAEVVGIGSASLSSIPISKGWSLISFPNFLSGIETARQLFQRMNQNGVDVRFIVRWSGGRYVYYQTGSVDTFPVGRGQGYFIRNFGAPGTFNLP